MTADTVSRIYVDTVSRIYKAFGEGDVATILGYLDEQVAWDADWADHSAHRAGVAHFAPRRGRDEVLGFFAFIGKGTIHEFAVLDIMSSDRQVVVQVTIDWTLPSGGRLRDEELHLWTFGPDGRVVALRHYVDTAKHIQVEAGLGPVSKWGSERGEAQASAGAAPGAAG